MYLERDALARLRGALQRASLDEPLVFVSTGRAPGDDGFALEVERYPGRSIKRVAVFDFHGEWLAWGK